MFSINLSFRQLLSFVTNFNPNNYQVKDEIYALFAIETEV